MLCAFVYVYVWCVAAWVGLVLWFCLSTEFVDRQNQTHAATSAVSAFPEDQSSLRLKRETKHQDFSCSCVLTTF